jgi:hypothetical protein
MVIHWCDRRMYGNHRHNSTYYMCHPSRTTGDGRTSTPDEKAAYIREDDVLGAVSRLYEERVFGPHRRELLAADLATVNDRETREREAERERLQRTLADLARRQDNVMRQAQDCAPDDPFGHGLRQTYNNLEAERRTVLASTAELDAAEQAGPPRPTAEDVDLLDALPHLTLKAPSRDPKRGAYGGRSPGFRQFQSDVLGHALIIFEGVIADQTTWSGLVCGGAPGQVRTASARTRQRRELLVSTTVEISRRRRGQGGDAR